MRELLARIDLFGHLQELPHGSATKATALLQNGAVQSLAWISEDQIAIQLLDGEYPFTAQIHRSVSELQFHCSCQTGGPTTTLPCTHTAAGLLLTNMLAKGAAGTLRLPFGDRESLKSQFQGESPPALEKSAPQKPNLSQGTVIVDLTTRDDDEPLFHFRSASVDYGYSYFPEELKAFANIWNRKELAERHFYEWLLRPSSIRLAISVNGEVVEIPRTPPIQVFARTELDLGDKEVNLRRRLTQLDNDAPLKEIVLVASNMIWLPATKRFGWIARDESDDLWDCLLDEFHTYSSFAADDVPPIETESTGFKIALSHDQWNRLLLPWPPSDWRGKNWHGVSTDGRPADIATALPTLHLDIAKFGPASLRLDLRMQANAIEVDYVQQALEIESVIIDSYSNRQLVRKAERRNLLTDSLYRLMTTPDYKKHTAIIKETKTAPVFSRLKTAKREVDRVLRDVDERSSIWCNRTLHVSTDSGKPKWFHLETPLAQVAEAILLLRKVLPDMRVADDEEPLDTEGTNVVPFPMQKFSAAHDPDDDIWDDVFDDLEDEDHRRVLVAPEARVLENFSALLLACQAGKIELTFEKSAIEPVRLDVSVRATPQEGAIDWFELTPEITADGSKIPQEHWEAWATGKLMHGADGRVRVIHPESKEALEKFQNILGVQTGERARDGKRSANEPLRVPRLRIFDWMALRKAGVRCELPPEEAAVLHSLAGFEAIPEVPLPDRLRATLRPYQIDGYRWLAFLYRHRFGACLADDMGLGKTIQTVALLGAVKQGLLHDPNRPASKLPHLIVLPPTLLFNWRYEIETFFPELTVSELTGPERSLDPLDADVVLTTYEVARRDIAKLEKRKFDVIVFDEAQAIKNLTANRSRAMRRLKGRFKVCLTGTPVENHAGEYYSILELALPGLFGDYKAFLTALRQPASFNPLDRARPFVMRRTKEKILSELPPKVETDDWLQLSDTQKNYYTRAVAEVREEVLAAFRDKTAAQAGIIALSALTRLRQICISPGLLDQDYAETSPKIEHLIAKLIELHEEGHAALIFSQFTRALDLLETHLQAQKLDYLRIDGSTPLKKRKESVAAFQRGEGSGFFLISLKTGGVGLNLTRASYVFHLDPWWNPAVENQASDRAHRIGQKQHVFVHRLLMRHTIEEKMMILKARKRAVFDQVLSGTENRTGASLLTRADMAWLLDP